MDEYGRLVNTLVIVAWEETIEIPHNSVPEVGSVFELPDGSKRAIKVREVNNLDNEGKWRVVGIPIRDR